MEGLKDLYYDPTTGFTGLVKFYKRIKEINPDITMTDIKGFLNRQYTFQINRQGVRPKFYRTILAKSPRDNYQMDIMVYDRYADGNYKNILCVVDVNSRYADAEPLKSRKVDEVDGLLPAIKKIFKRMGKPKNVNSDNEFLQSKSIQKYFSDEGIIHHVSDPDEINKQAIVERFNRTLALLLQRYREGTGKNNWSSVLDDLMNNYNSSYHRTIRGRPIDVWSGLSKNKQSPIYMFEDEINVGDNVRIKMIKLMFGKGDSLKYSPEIYNVVEQKDGVEDGKKLRKYKLRNIETNKILTKPRTYWKSYELKKVDNIIDYNEGQEDITEKAKVVLEDNKKELEEVVKSQESLKTDPLLMRRDELSQLLKDDIRKIGNRYKIAKHSVDGKITYKPKAQIIEDILKYEKLV